MIACSYFRQLQLITLSSFNTGRNILLQAHIIKLIINRQKRVFIRPLQMVAPCIATISVTIHIKHGRAFPVISQTVSYPNSIKFEG